MLDTIGWLMRVTRRPLQLAKPRQQQLVGAYLGVGEDGRCTLAAALFKVVHALLQRHKRGALRRAWSRGGR